MTEQNKLYVKNLSYSVTEIELKEYFSQFGEIVFCKVLRDHVTNRSRGCGFIGFKTREMADKAIEMAQDQDMMGRALVVEFARERSEKPAPSFNTRAAIRPIQAADHYSYPNREDMYQTHQQPEMTHHSTWGDWQEPKKQPRRLNKDRRRFND